MELIRVGVDTGGTFTDFILIKGDQLLIHKEPSDPEQPAKPIIEGLSRLIGTDNQQEIICGSTVATNTILERKGARTALITTKGFEDLLEIGRQNRQKIYDLNIDRPPSLIPPELRFGLKERVSAQGEIIKPLQEREIERLVAELKGKQVEAVAVCLLFSYLNPVHEEKLAEKLQNLCLFLSLSHRILPEFREYERCSTTVINAYVAPRINQYLSLLTQEVGRGRLRIMQSNGGCISATTASQEPVRTIFSGPAAGVLAARELARLAGFSKVITLDMGGTSTDVSLVDDRISYTTEATIGGLPVKVPMIDIHTVGAGGGSLAYVDSGGALRVGPFSAGADPGPACYGKGGKGVTVTDANLFLGRLDPDNFLGGEKRLYPEEIGPPLTRLARQLGLSLEETASGVLQVVNANMERAVRVISVERGHDPRDFSLVAFGGAGPLHACELASNLLIPRIIIPRSPGTLSALGLLLADIVKDYSQTILLRSERLTTEELDSLFLSLERKAQEEMLTEGFLPDKIMVERYLDLRYVGQSYELMIPYRADFLPHFHELHQHLYGYCLPHRETEIVNLRIKAIGQTRKPRLPYRRYEELKELPKHSCIKEKDCYLGGRWQRLPVWQRDLLEPGQLLRGPAIILEYSSTIFITPDYRAWIDSHYNLILEREGVG